MSIIHSSESKFVKFVLYKPHERYRKNKEYSLGDVVYDGGVYYEYANASSVSGTSLSDVTYWTPSASRPRYDTTAIVGMIIVLYFKGSRNAVAMYSLNPSGGFLTIDDTDSALSEYSIELSRTLTQKKKEGVLCAEIKLTETSVGAVDGVQTTIISDISIAEINSPITEFISVP
jgi:hypothetical protein